MERMSCCFVLACHASESEQNAPEQIYSIFMYIFVLVILVQNSPKRLCFIWTGISSFRFPSRAGRLVQTSRRISTGRVAANRACRLARQKQKSHHQNNSVRVLLLPLWGIGKQIIDRSNTEFKQSVVGKTSFQGGIFLGKKK